MAQINEPLRLEGAHNIRELGGYPAGGKKRTRPGVFLRGDSTHALSVSDLATLREAGVTLAVDMRSPDEVEQNPSRFFGAGGVRYENVVMFDGLHSALFGADMPSSMAELYIRLLDNCQEQYGRIFRCFSENTEGVSLFHCTAGKDRTGVAAMLLLQLAGVPDTVIAADYAASERHLTGLFERQHEQFRKIGLEVPAFVLGSRVEDMEQTLAHLRMRYGGAAAYLRQCGLTAQEADTLVARFVE